MLDMLLMILLLLTNGLGAATDDSHTEIHISTVNPDISLARESQ